MRILVLTNMYPPHAYGGYEQSCRDVVERWRVRGHEVLVLTSAVRVRGVDSGAESRSAVRRELHLYWDDHVILRPPPWRRLAWELANRRSLDGAVDDFRPDVASAWAMGAMSFGVLSRLASRGVPVVPVICDEWPVYGPEIDGWLRLWAHRPRLGRVARAVTGLPTEPPPLDEFHHACFVSDALRTAVRARSRWTFPRSGVVHSGIETRDFEIGLSPRPATWAWRLLYVGRIDPRKGVDVVIRALALCPNNASLAVVGHGDEHHLAELRALASELGVGHRVKFGRSPRADLANIYRQADAVVFPPTWDEPFGLVPLEAMACGTPVVASPTGGSAEYLRDGDNCLAFAPGDAEGLHRALKRLADDVELRHRLVRSGIGTAPRFDIDRVAEKLEALHRSAAGPDSAGNADTGEHSLSPSDSP